MRKILLFGLWLLLSDLYAQNLQIHYDFSSERNYMTSTLEMYKPDTLGATFWFVDFDYNSWRPNKSASLAYWEIARYFALPSFDRRLSATLQYNDGLMIGADASGQWGLPLDSAWLLGLNYAFPLKNASLTVELLYRYMDVSRSPDAQLTIVWFLPLFHERIHFMGYLDYYTQDLPTDAGIVKKPILQSEPQLWYVLNQTFCIGGEVELDYNFGGYLGEFKAFPTLGIKWNF